MPMRTFTDSSGTVWDVFEAHPGGGGRTLSRVPESFRTGWLCFQSASERRRLAPIPPDWESWEVSRLVAALHTTHGMARRTPKAFDASRPPRRSGETAQV